MKVSKIPVLLTASMALALPACSKLEAQYGKYSLTAEADFNGSETSEHGSGGHGSGVEGVEHHAVESVKHEAEHAEHDAAHGESHGGEHHAQHKIVVTSPLKKDVVSTQQFVCQIHSCRHIEVRALEGGYLEAIPVREGQSVKQGEMLFHILPTLYQAKLDADVAEAQLAQIELSNTENLFNQNIVSQQEVALAKAKLAKAQAQVKLAQAEMNFADIKAPFDGIIDRLHEQQGSLIEEGDILTTLSDNSVMWVYFNVPEARYLEYQASAKNNPNHNDMEIQLKLANGKIFDQAGEIGAIEADFNNETGNIAFRADFSNPEGLLRHGQTGTILIHREQEGAIVIPQRATYEILAKKYVYVVDENDIVHQHEITIKNELEDIFLVDGLATTDKIILEGIRQVRDGEKVEYEFQTPEEVLANLKYHAE